MCAPEDEAGDREAIELVELGMIAETVVNGESRYHLTSRSLALVAMLVGQEAEASKRIDAAVEKLLSSPAARTCPRIGALRRKHTYRRRCGIGAALIIVFWVVVDFFLGLGYGIYRLATRSR